ncbi:MAG: prepilin-type N-terminal cleavage/methylation domain-containing protein [Phycisphaerae bacterium]|nr:prepilin-type N-terminal cleavage/methylation domain-containing protein [Phycisphaerae bacterium]
MSRCVSNTGPEAFRGSTALRPRRLACPAHRAFTLIEVLVVVAIVALLVAVLIPSLTRAREQSKNTVCMSNLRQFAYGFQFYSQDYRLNPPPNRVKPSRTGPYYGTPPDYRDSDWWYYRHMVPKYLAPEKLTATSSAFFGVFACPGDTKQAGRSYSMNIFAGNFPMDPPDNTATPYSNGRPFNPYSVKMSYRYMVLVESFADHEDSKNRGVFGTDYVVGLSGPTYSKYKDDIDFGKHRGRANFLLGDLHVESLGKDRISQSNATDPGKRASSLRIWWSPEDDQWNVALPE